MTDRKASERMRKVFGRINRRWRELGLALALVSSTAGVLEAQTTAATPGPVPAGAKITFAEAVQIALHQNTSVRQAENAQFLSSATVRAQQLQFLPSLQLSTTGAQNIGRTFGVSDGTIVDQNTQSLSAGVSTDLTLFNGLSNVAALKQANLGADASAQDLTRARQTAAFTVASNYLTVISDEEQLRVQQENLTAQTTLEDQISKLVDAGSRAISDLYQQQAIVAAARFAVTSAQRDLEVARVQLIQTLQLDPSKSYDFVPPEISEPDTATNRFDLDSLLVRAYAHRTDLAAAGARVSAASQGVKSATGARWPTLSLSADYSSSFNSAADVSLTDQLDQRRGGSIALGLSIPVFDRGEAGLAIERARIDEDNARLALEDQKRTVGLEVRQAYVDYDAARQQLAAAQAQLKAGDLAVTTAQQRYEAGAGTLVELAQARATRVQAASAVITARYQLVFQTSLMSYYTGEMDPEHIAV